MPRDRCGSTFRNFHTSLSVRFHLQPPPQGQRPKRTTIGTLLRNMPSGFYRLLDRLSDENAELSDSPGAENALLSASSSVVRGHVRDKYCQHSRATFSSRRGEAMAHREKYFLYQRTRYRQLSFSEPRRKAHLSPHLLLVETETVSLVSENEAISARKKLKSKYLNICSSGSAFGNPSTAVF